MPPTYPSGFTHVFRADIAGDRPRRVTKRARQPVSCQLCRTRKLKCDREQPVCGACLKRGDQDSCNYSSPTTSGGIIGVSSAGDGPSPKPKRGLRPREEVQGRLQQLEQLVSGLISQGYVPGTPPTSSLSPTDNQTTTVSTETSSPLLPHVSSGTTGGHISRNGIEMPFVGATHWAAVLESIHDIRDCLEEADGESGHDSPPSDLATAGQLDPLFGTNETITIGGVMAALPSRRRTDSLLGVYGKAKFTSSPIIHAQQFRRQYESFWISPASTSFLWISILFSTLAMAILDEIPHVGKETALSQQSFYAGKAMQCLVAGQYLKAKPWAVEALIAYALIRVSERKDSDLSLWSFFSVSVRLAQRMGYHRDPSQITSPAGIGGRRSRITPFQAEMRRRTWFFLEAFDLLYSMQLGMPTVIQDDQCDVAPPTNLLDEDFDEDTVVLPPARPDTELTKALYLNYKSKLLRQMRRIVLHALSVHTRDYEETLALHDGLKTLHDNIPPPLGLPDLRGAVAAADADRTTTILHHVALELMYLKSLCILHRPYLARRKTDLLCELSRQSCRQAALKILDLHTEMEVDVRPSGKMFEEGYLLGPMTLHDFLVAAMVLCLDLNETTGLPPDEREKELRALHVAYGNCSKRASTSKDAAHAQKVLGAMLRKVSKLDTTNQRDRSPPQIVPPQSLPRPKRKQPNTEMPWIEHPYVSTPPDPAPASTPGPVSQEETFPSRGLLSTMGFLGFSDVAMGASDFLGQDTLGNIIDNSDDIDWNMVDSYLLDRDRSIMEVEPGDLFVEGSLATARLPQNWLTKRHT